MGRQNSFNFLAKDASKPEDRGTVLTRWVVYKEWKRPETFRTDAGTNAHAVGGRTDEIVHGSIFDKRSDIWNRSAPRWGYESLEAKTTHRHQGV